MNKSNIIKNLKNNGEHSARLAEINNAYAKGLIDNEQFNGLLAEEESVHAELRTKYAAAAVILGVLGLLLILS